MIQFHAKSNQESMAKEKGEGLLTKSLGHVENAKGIIAKWKPK